MSHAISGQAIGARKYSAGRPVEMHIQLTIDYERFGVPVDMHAPDASDTT